MVHIRLTPTTSAPLCSFTLTWDKLQAALEPFLRQQIDIALGSNICVLYGAKYLAVGGTDVWNLWVELLRPRCVPREVACIVILNVEFRCSKHIPKDECYVIRVPNHANIFQKYWWR